MASSPRRQNAGLAQEPPYYAKATPTLLSLVPADVTERRPPSSQTREWAALYIHFESRFGALYNWRLPWWQTASQIARYQKPERYYAFITANVYNDGRRRDFDIVDRTATLCGEICAAGLMSGLTDPDSDWLVLGPSIPGVELDTAAQQWYTDLTERLAYVYDHSNFYEMQAQQYDDLTFFGTSVGIDYEDEKEIIRVKVPCSGEYMLGNGFDGSDEVLYEEYRQTVSQIVEGFGPDNCPEDVLALWRQKGAALQTEFVIGHAIEPNFAIQADGVGGEGVGVVPGGFTWREAFWIRGKKDVKPLSLTGFHEQPHASMCWGKQGNDAYGRGVGEKMLGDTIQLQLETRQKAESIEKVNRPPMGADVSLQNLPAATSPGKITYFNTGSNGEKKFFPLYEIKPDIAALSADIALIQARIGKTAFNDVFQPMLNLRDRMKTQITATETDEIKEESLLPLGPVFGRVYASLRTRVRRHLSIMARRGMIPPKPASIRGVPTKIDFVSVLTSARKARATGAIARAVQFAGSVSGVYPEARFVIDPDEAIREFTDGVGATSKILRSPQQIKKLQQQEAQQNAAANAMKQTAEGAAAASGLAKTSLAPGNALSALVGGSGQ